MAKLKIVVTRKWPEQVEAKLQELYDVELNAADKPMTTAQLQNALRNADAVLPTVTDAVNAEVLSAEPLRAKIIASFGVGFNHVDTEAAKACGLTVTNTPEVLTDCTADLAMTLLLMVARRTGEGERHVRAKAWTGWRPTHMMGTRVTGKTLGLVGMGRIARAVAQRAHFGFGMKILFADPYPPPAALIESLDAEQCSLEDLLKRSDFVSLHCPATKETYHLLNAGTIGLMRPDAYLINTARGDVVDGDAVIDALKNNRIAGAGLDVFEGEPDLDKRFLDLENAVLLPHLGSASVETRVAMGERVLENIGAFFAGETSRDKIV